MPRINPHPRVPLVGAVAPNRPAGNVRARPWASEFARASGFTIVEVMMAAVILTVGFMGMIEAVTVTSGMMDHARRQSFANQILNAEIEDLRMLRWDVSGSTNDIVGLPTTSTALVIEPMFWPAWNNKSTYVANHVVSYNGAWYRCILANLNQVPTNPAYWTSVTAGAAADIVSFSGATFTVTRSLTATDPVANNLREVTITVSWVVTTSRKDAGGNPLTFTYTRTQTAWLGKYGLNLSLQRS